MGKKSGWAGIIAVALSTSAIIVMAAVRTDGYNHAHKAISELGSWDAPNRWIFNISGYLVPGLLIALFALQLQKHFTVKMRSYPFHLLMLSGCLMALAGVFPIDMEHRDSLSSLLHAVGSGGSGLMWLLSSLTLWWQLRKEKSWKTIAIVSLLIPFVTISLMILVPPTSPGIAQRIGFAGYYLDVLLLSIGQLVMARNSRYQLAVDNKLQ